MPVLPSTRWHLALPRPRSSRQVWRHKSSSHLLTALRFPVLARRGMENSAVLSAEFERGAPQAHGPRRARLIALGTTAPPKSSASFWRHT